MRYSSNVIYGKSNSRNSASIFESFNWRLFGMCIGSSSIPYITDPWAQHLILVKLVLNKGCTNIKVEVQETNAVKAAGIFCLLGVGFSVGTYIVYLLLRCINLKFKNKKKIRCQNCSNEEDLQNIESANVLQVTVSTISSNCKNILRQRIRHKKLPNNYDYIKFWINSCDKNGSTLSYSPKINANITKHGSLPQNLNRESGFFDSQYASAILSDEIASTNLSDEKIFNKSLIINQPKQNKYQETSSLFNLNFEDESGFGKNSEDLFSENKSFTSGNVASLYDFRDSHLHKAYSIDLGEDLHGMTFLGGGSLLNESEAKLIHLEKELLKVQTDVGKLTHHFGTLSRSWDDTLLPVGWVQRWTPTHTRSFSFDSLTSGESLNISSKALKCSERSCRGDNSKQDEEGQDLSWDYQYDLVGRIVNDETNISVNKNDLEWTYSDIDCASVLSSSQEISPIKNDKLIVSMNNLNIEEYHQHILDNKLYENDNLLNYNDKTLTKIDRNLDNLDDVYTPKLSNKMSCLKKHQENHFFFKYKNEFIEDRGYYKQKIKRPRSAKMPKIHHSPISLPLRSLSCKRKLPSIHI